jgi:serine protease AprX
MNTHGTQDRSDDTVTSYSSKGPSAIDHIVKPDVVAPGNQIVSLEQGYLKSAYPSNRAPNSFYHNTTGTSVSDKYFVLSGTSMAAGAVSGVIADLLEAHPALTPDQVKASLMKTASKNFPAFSAVVAVSPPVSMTCSPSAPDMLTPIGLEQLARTPSSGMAAYFDSATGNVYFFMTRMP